MRLPRIGPAGSGKPAGLLDEYTFVDLSDVATDFDQGVVLSGVLAPR